MRGLIAQPGQLRLWWGSSGSGDRHSRQRRRGEWSDNFGGLPGSDSDLVNLATPVSRTACLASWVRRAAWQWPSRRLLERGCPVFWILHCSVRTANFFFLNLWWNDLASCLVAECWFKAGLCKSTALGCLCCLTRILNYGNVLIL